jgi:hypothetical protein
MWNFVPKQGLDPILSLMISECITGSTEIPESHDAQSRACTDVSELQPDEFCNVAELPLKNSLLGMRPETCHQQLVNDHEYRYTADALPPQILSHQSTRFNAKPSFIP